MTAETIRRAILSACVTAAAGCGGEPASPAPAPPRQAAPVPPTLPIQPAAPADTAGLTAEALSDAFHADPAAFDATYRGRPVRFEGELLTASRFVNNKGVRVAGGKRPDGSRLTVVVILKAVDESVWRIEAGRRVAVAGVVRDALQGYINIEQATVTPLEPSNPLTVSAEELTRAFANGVDTAVAWYDVTAGGREVVVRGTVQDIPRWDDEVVYLAGADGVRVKCRFDREERKALAVGRAVTVKGMLTRYFDGERKAVEVNAAFVLR